jgi:hypothetical protein
MQNSGIYLGVRPVTRQLNSKTKLRLQSASNNVLRKFYIAEHKGFLLG